MASSFTLGLWATALGKLCIRMGEGKEWGSGVQLLHTWTTFWCQETESSVIKVWLTASVVTGCITDNRCSKAWATFFSNYYSQHMQKREEKVSKSEVNQRNRTFGLTNSFCSRCTTEDDCYAKSYVKTYSLWQHLQESHHPKFSRHNYPQNRQH